MTTSTLRFLKMSILAGMTSILALTASAEEILFSNAMPDFEPVRDVAPTYPQRALERKISGYSLVEYRIQPSGQVSDVKVVDSSPSAVFNKASKRAVLRTVYDKTDAARVQGDTFYRMFVYELDTTNANLLAVRQ